MIAEGLEADLSPLGDNSTVDQCIKLLKSKGKDWAKQDGRVTGLKLSHLQGICNFYGMVKRGKEEELIEYIFQKFNQVEAIAKLQSVTPSFVSDVNTFPRLCNIVMKYPQQLLQTGVLSTRLALQTGDVGANASIWADVAENFNDPGYNVGPLVDNHPAFERRQINPASMNKSEITPAKCQELFRDVMKQFSDMYRRFTNSGKHNNHDFWNYCQGKVDPLYLHLCLQKADTEILSFCAEGAEHDDGVDSAEPDRSSGVGEFSTPSRVPESGSGSSTKKRKLSSIEESYSQFMDKKLAASVSESNESRMSFLNDEIDKLEDQIAELKASAGFKETDDRFVRKMAIMKKYASTLDSLLKK